MSRFTVSTTQHISYFCFTIIMDGERTVYLRSKSRLYADTNHIPSSSPPPRPRLVAVHTDNQDDSRDSLQNQEKGSLPPTPHTALSTHQSRKRRTIGTNKCNWVSYCFELVFDLFFFYCIGYTMVAGMQ